jgi:hypothetical protein
MALLQLNAVRCLDARDLFDHEDRTVERRAAVSEQTIVIERFLSSKTTRVNV